MGSSINRAPPRLPGLLDLEVFDTLQVQPANRACGRVADSDKREVDSLEGDAPAFDLGRSRAQPRVQ
jgi:hypothetical protein